MSFGSILYTILIMPLQLFFEVLFVIANRFVQNPGLSIIVLSLMMNFLVLPLYRRADAMQEEERDMSMKLRKGVSHIKKSFSGDEKMMILNTYYKQNHHKPTDAFKGSISLFLEIPFFIAAYQFLSHLQALKGFKFGPIADLGAPDQLLTIGGITLNILPIIMTAVNLVSCVIYTKGFPIKTKIQLYAMAIFFLVFLYSSPAGLVFYWTLNNIFSLVKTIFYKLKNPLRVLGVIFSIVGIILLGSSFTIFHTPSMKKKIFVAGVGILFQLPLLYSVWGDTLKEKIKLKKTFKREPDRRLFLAGGLFLTVLTGLLIPSSVIKASPQEFVDVTYFQHPGVYLLAATCLAFGLFVIWMGVFYWLAKPSGKVCFEKMVWILSGVAIVDYMFFGTKLGILSSTLQYENGLLFGKKDKLINLAIIFVVAIVLLVIVNHWKNFSKNVLLVALIAFICMSVMNIRNINKSVKQVKKQVEASRETASFNLSKKGKNVVVIMLDRAMGEYVPYMFNEKPELKEKFAGFTYYSNVVSHGPLTNFATPSLFGGYEYTPDKMNARKDKPLYQDQNEADRLMPVIFDEAGYQVTVCDPPYANYQWTSDLSIYDDHPNIKAYNTDGTFSNPKSKERIIDSRKRNFFCYSIMKIMPLAAQNTLYCFGNYNEAAKIGDDEFVYGTQRITSMSTADELNGLFMNGYNVLLNLKNITKIDEGDTNTFLMMVNNTTHEPTLLQEPEYVPKKHVDNTEYDAAHQDRFTVNGITLNFPDESCMAHYQTNMAAMIQIANWLDYLRENDVYDNTRIILVSDHGRYLQQLEELRLNEGTWKYNDAEFYYPLLMVKDFGDTEFKTSTEFMTNADVPTLATNDVIENPVNPATGNPVNSDEKKNGPTYVIVSSDFDIGLNNGNQFHESYWYKVHDDIWNKDNWTWIDTLTTDPK